MYKGYPYKGYTPDYECLADAAKRVMAAGANERQAKLDICRALADRKISFLAKIDAADRSYGGRALGPRNVAVPRPLEPEALDWNASRPLARWKVGPDDLNPAERYFSIARCERRSIELVQLSTRDLDEVFGGLSEDET